MDKQGKNQVGNWYGIVIAVLCLLTYSVSFVCRNVWNSVIAIPGVTDSLGITALQAGGLATAFYVGYVLSNLFSGFLVDKFGPKISLVFAAAGTGIFTLIIPFSTSYAMIFFLRVMAGIFSGPLFAGCAKMNYGWFDDKRRGVAVGFIMSGPAVGTAIASAAFTPIVQSQGWQQGFVIAGIVAIIIGVLMLLLGKEKGLALANNKQQLTKAEKQENTRAALKVFMKKDMLMGTFMHFLIVGAQMGMTTWILAFFVNVHGMDPAAAGLIFGGSQALGLVSGTLAGMLSDLLKTRKWLVIVGGVMSGILMYSYTLTSDATILTIIAVCVQLFGAVLGNSNNIMQTERAKCPQAGKVGGWYNAIAQCGSVVYPSLAGAILHVTGSYYVVMMVFALTYIVVAALGFTVKDTYVRENKKVLAD